MIPIERCETISFVDFSLKKRMLTRVTGSSEQFHYCRMLYQLKKLKLSTMKVIDILPFTHIELLVPRANRYFVKKKYSGKIGKL